MQVSCGHTRYTRGMNDKESILILTAMLKKYPLAEDEREAIRTALGILGWSKFAESGLEARKAKRAA